MNTKRLFIEFGAVTAFEVRCKSAALRACCRATGWPATEAQIETKKAVPNVMELFRQVRQPVDEESRLERRVPLNRVETNILVERPL
jgi:hypothetical protein